MNNYKYVDWTLTNAGKEVYPDSGTAPLDPNQEMPINGWGVSLPPNASYVRDVLKLIVTTNQVDLSYLQMDAPKGAENALAAEPPNDPLNRLLFESAIGAKDAGRRVADNWYLSEAGFDYVHPNGHICL